jgi:thiol-disulfide isomerase/thioredoxin
MRRITILLTLLGLSLLALWWKPELQAVAWGLSDNPLVGHAAPEFTAASLDGGRVRSAEWRGRPALLHFWTFGCGNCKRMIPRYGEWHSRYEKSGLVVAGIHTPELDWERDTERLRAFVRDRHIRWPVLLDPDYAVWERYRVAAWPTIVLVDKSGVVRNVFVGDNQSDAIERALQKLL